MLFRGNNSRRHRRYAYLQFITFFSLGPMVAEGCRRGVGIDLSESGMCIYTPARLREGQVILINDPPPVSGPKAVVRWVRQYGATEPYYEAGLMFGDRREEDPPSSSCGESSDSDCMERRSSVIEGLGDSDINYPSPCSEDFWADMTELPEREADQLIGLSSRIMRSNALRDYASLRFLRGSACLRKARIIAEGKGRKWDDSSLGLVEESLINLKAAAAPPGDRAHQHDARFMIEEQTDAAATLLESGRPGRTQEILGRTKLKYMRERIFHRNRLYGPADEEMESFLNIPFHYRRIVRSAEILYKPVGEPGKRSVNILLYEETSSRNASDEPNEPLCIMGLVEDGTFHLIKDFDNDASYEERSGELHDVQEGEAGDVKTEHAGKIGKADFRQWEEPAPETAAMPDEMLLSVMKRPPEVPMTFQLPGTDSRRKRSRYAAVIAAGIAALLLTMAVFFLVSHMANRDSLTGDKAVRETQSVDRREASERIKSLFDQEGNGTSASSTAGEPLKSGGRGNPVVPRKKKGDGQGNGPGHERVDNQKQHKAGPARGGELPGDEKRSFPPPSRDNL